MVKKEKLTIEQKARQIVDNGNVFKMTDDIYIVVSQSNPEKDYQVIFPLKKCECPNNEYNPECKHWLAVKMVKDEEFRKIVQNILTTRMKQAVQKIGVIQ